MKSLFRFALAGALSYVLVKWARQWLEDIGEDLPTLNPAPKSRAHSYEPGAYEPDTAEPSTH